MLNDNSCHIVQIGTDDSVFNNGHGAEYVSRQVLYGDLLDKLCPGGSITIIAFTRNREAVEYKKGNVVFLPLVVELLGLSKFHAWLKLYLQLLILHRRKKINILTTQTVQDEAWVVLLFAKIKKIPIVGQIHYDIFSPHIKKAYESSKQGRLRYNLMLTALRLFTAIRVVGTGIRKEILTRHLHSNVHVIPVPMLMISERGKFNGDTTRKLEVLYVGRLVEQKNLYNWIQIAQLVATKVPEATFKIVGDGKLKDELAALVDKLELTPKFEFTGYMDYFKLVEIYRSASLFLLTSHYEGFGRVIAEALYNRLPVVAPQITGVEDIIVHGRSGFLNNPYDLYSFAESVIFLLRNPSAVQTMGEFGEQYVRAKYDCGILMNQWLQLLITHSNTQKMGLIEK